MMRGINLIFRQNWGKKYGTAFLKLQLGAQEEVISARLKDFPLLPKILVAEARDSIEMMRQLEMRESEREMCDLQAEMVRLMSVSSLEGLASLSPHLFRFRLRKATSIPQIQRPPIFDFRTFACGVSSFYRFFKYGCADHHCTLCGIACAHGANQI